MVERSRLGVLRKPWWPAIGGQDVHPHEAGHRTANANSVCTRDINLKKAPRTQKDNLAELKKLRELFDDAPIDSITPATIAGYRDARTAKVRTNREIATLSHVFNMVREWGITTKENPCQGVRKNKEKPRDYYANDVVWDPVYKKAPPALKEAMDLAYLTRQRPADGFMMRRDDGMENSLGALLRVIAERNA